jgi:hypothetical protein
MRSFATTVFSSVFLLCAAACGGAEPPPPANPGGATPAPSAVPSSAPSPAASADDVVVPATWSTTMPKEAQIAFMKKNVAPRMAKVFQGADAARYASFGCKTCHGPQFKPPKEFLPHLTLKDGKMTAFGDKPEVAKFMAEHVVPEMASAMGQPPYDPQTHQGFGCGGCHAIDMK